MWGFISRFQPPLYFSPLPLAADFSEQISNQWYMDLMTPILWRINLVVEPFDSIVVSGERTSSIASPPLIMSFCYADARKGWGAAYGSDYVRAKSGLV
jgi:hypothetical protein